MTDETEQSESSEAGTGESSVGVQPPKRRGRPPGSGKRQQSEGEIPNAVPSDEKAAGAKRGPKKRGKGFSADDLANLSKQIQGLHALGAMMTGIPELQLHDKEAEMLAGGVVAVAKEYNLDISGKTGAMIQLAAACAAIYVPRFVVIKNRVAKQREQEGVTIDGETGAVAAP